MDKNEFTNVQYNNVQLVKKIGHGAAGTVWRARLDLGRPVDQLIVKVAKLLPGALLRNHAVWRELEFYKDRRLRGWPIALDWKIIPCADFKIAGKSYEHPDQLNDLPLKYRRIQQALKKSKHCLVCIMPFIEGHDLKWYLNRVADNGLRMTGFTKKQYYGWFINLLEQVAFLHSAGYTHGDIHPGNILIGNGMATLIDYGTVNSKKWDSKWDPTTDFSDIFWLTHITNHQAEYSRVAKKITAQKITTGQKPATMPQFPTTHAAYINGLKRFFKTAESKHFLELCQRVPAKIRKHYAFALAEMQIPDFIKQLCGRSYANELKFKELWLIDESDAIFFLNHCYTGEINLVIKRLKSKSRL